MDIYVDKQCDESIEDIIRDEPEQITRFYVEDQKLYAKLLGMSQDVVLAVFKDHVEVDPRDRIHCKFMRNSIKVSIR